jgi:hypothetical protein
MMMAKDKYENYTYRKISMSVATVLAPKRLATIGSLDPANQRRPLDKIDFVQTPRRNRLRKSVRRWPANVQPQAGIRTDCTDYAVRSYQDRDKREGKSGDRWLIGGYNVKDGGKYEACRHGGIMTSQSGAIWRPAWLTRLIYWDWTSPYELCAFLFTNSQSLPNCCYNHIVVSVTVFPEQWDIKYTWMPSPISQDWSIDCYSSHQEMSK